MEEKPTYYAVIPAQVRYDFELPDKAKLLYGEIVALSDKEGICWATNNYFAELYNVSKITISRLINLLAKKKYINISMKYKEGSKEIDNRYIQICLYPINKNDNTPINKNVKDNNTSINNTSINKENINISKDIFIKEDEKKFKKPTIEEIQEYCNERKNNVDPEKFFYFYESKGWVVGKNKMKNWKASIISWERNSNNTKKSTREATREFLDRQRKQFEEEMKNEQDRCE